MTLYLAIDAATEENGCMHIVHGSHHLGVVNDREGAGKQPPPQLISRGYAERLLAFTAFLDEDQIPTVLSAYPSKPLPLLAGELIILSTLCLHSSGVNTTGGPRRALSTCLMDGATRFAADGSDTGATVLIGDESNPFRLGVSTITQPIHRCTLAHVRHSRDS